MTSQERDKEVFEDRERLKKWNESRLKKEEQAIKEFNILRTLFYTPSNPEENENRK